MSEHVIKVQQPYFDAVLSGDKTFEVRKNDRGYQAGDDLVLVEFTPGKCYSNHEMAAPNCPNFGRRVRSTVTYVYSGDPRFGGIEQGFVVLGLGTLDFGGAS